jgi:TonB-linked SusC/RagA family outer membrane protein
MICFMAFGASMAFGQQQARRITGTVTDTEGEALIGASVTVQGTSSGAVTDLEGQFAVTAKSGDVLTVSYLGYVTQTVTVGDQSDYRIVMSDNATLLEDVVVVGYGTLEKRQVTNSITSLSARDLPQGLGGATIAGAMKGKVNNLVIEETASPNTGTTLQLRGMASVNATKDPLVVIDGMPGGDIRSVAQEDIQSIDILKDAGAGAIYGTRANGGVILITTKQAQEGKMKLQYTGEAIYKSAFGKPRVMTADEFRQYRPDYDWDEMLYPGTDWTQQKHFGIDWWDAGLADDPISYRHVLSINGGSANARIYATVTYEDQKGVMLYDTREDVSGRVNGSFKLVDGWLDVNTHLEYRQADRNLSSPGASGLLSLNPTADPDNPLCWDFTNMMAQTNPIRDAFETTKTGLDKWFRPDVELRLNILPVKGLSYTQSLGYENRQYEYHRYEPSTLRQGEWTNPSGNGTAELSFDKTDLMNIDSYFSYVNKIGDIHSINATLGFNYYERNREYFGMVNHNFPKDGTALWNIGAGENLRNPPGGTTNDNPTMSSAKDISVKTEAFFGRLHYSLMDKYIASVTLRRESSSRFGSNTRWGLFHQESAAWRISKESFMQDISWINDLKIRVSYGVTGNDGFSASYVAETYGIYSTTTQALLPDGSWSYAYRQARNINLKLGWEEKHELNAGLDYELFNGRLFGKIDLYSRKVKDLIYNSPVSIGVYIYDTMYKNIGDFENKGVEVEIGAKILDTKDWQYTTKLNVSNNTTTIGKMSEEGAQLYSGYVGRAGDTHRIEEGAKVGSFYIYEFAGISDGSDKYTYTLADGTVKNIPAGHFLIYNNDIDDDHPNGHIVAPAIQTDQKDVANKRYIGSYQPKAIVGWSHDLQYKNWSLGMTLTSWIDFDIYNAYQHMNGSIKGMAASASSNVLLDVYTKNKDITGEAQECSYFLEDGTFLKIQNLTLGYRVNTKKYLKAVESARLYLTMNNLYTFTKYSGYNPEVNITSWENGIESVAYPQTRSFALGLQLTF